MLRMMGFRVAAGCDLGRSSLFRDTAFALPFPAFGGAGRSDFASLHQFADVPENGAISRWVLERRCKLSRKQTAWDLKTYDCRNLFPPSSFSCSERTISTRSTISSKLAWRALACLLKIDVSDGLVEFVWLCKG